MDSWLNGEGKVDMKRFVRAVILFCLAVVIATVSTFCFVFLLSVVDGLTSIQVSERSVEILCPIVFCGTVGLLIYLDRKYGWAARYLR